MKSHPVHTYNFFWFAVLFIILIENIIQNMSVEIMYLNERFICFHDGKLQLYFHSFHMINVYRRHCL